MIKRGPLSHHSLLKVSFLSLILLVPLKAAERKPIDENAVNQRLEAKFFFKKDKHQLVLKTNIENNEVLDQNKSISLDYRKKLTKGLKVILGHGVFFGLRHNEDWIVENGNWFWRDTGGRKESITHWGLQFKRPLSTETAYQIKALHTYNSFNEQQDVALHNSLMWFSTPKSVSLVELRLNFPANYARQTMNYYSLYTGWLYFITNGLSLGPSLSYGFQKWTEPLSYKGRFGDGYEVTNKVLFFGLTLNSYHDF